MVELFEYSTATWTCWLLVFTRISGAMMVLPIFSSSVIPMRIKTAIAALIALCVAPIALSSSTGGVTLEMGQLIATPLAGAVSICGELAIGWVLGATAAILMWGAHLGGQLIGQDSGLAFGQVVDPTTGQANTPTSTLMTIFAGLVFLALEGHRLVILALCGSFDSVPPGAIGKILLTGIPVETATEVTREIGGQTWLLGLQIAFPASVALLVTTIGLGILARMIPEMNVFAVGFAVRTGVGMLALFMTLPFIADLFGVVVNTGLEGSQLILDRIGGS